MSYSRHDDHAGADQDWKIALSYETIMGAYAKAVSKKSSSSAVVQKPGANYYDACFYPYTRPGIEPVFAVVGGGDVIVGRRNRTSGGIDVIQHFKEQIPTAGTKLENLCTATWIRDKRTGDPLLAVGGVRGLVKILNVRSGKVQRVLSGHGNEIMCIASHPRDQDIIASTGMDATVRFWSLDPKLEKQPCVLILAADGPRDTILTMSFHASGRYLLTGGVDRTINMWVIPEIGKFSAEPTDHVPTLVYPHFTTSMVHRDYVDCVAFYGDYIISRAAAEECIVLWSIQNFSSKIPPPGPEKAPPVNGWKDTRSAFGGTFERLIEFQAPDTAPFYMHFGLCFGDHPLLIMGSTTGKTYFWDLAMIERFGVSTADNNHDAPVPAGAQRDILDERLDVLIPPHRTLETAKIRSPIRSFAFSPDDQYIVQVGESSVIAILKR